MSNSTDAHERRKDRPRSRISYGVLALGMLSCVLVLGLFAWQSIKERSDRIAAEKESLGRMAEIVATDTASMFGRIRFFLQTADFWLSLNPGADPRTDPRFDKLVDEFCASMDYRVSIRLVSESGGIFYIPSASRAPLAEVSDREYYKAQVSGAGKGFFIGEPVRSRITGTWGIPLSYPLSARNAGMRVIYAAVEMPVLDELYDRVRPKPNGSIALLREDGIILARTPFLQDLIGTPIATDMKLWWSALRSSPDGLWTLRAVTDGAERILAVRIVEDPLLVVSVSARMGDVLEPWVTRLLWRTLLAALVVAVITIISIRLFFALRNLDEAQAQLRSNVETLARSDATKDKLFSVIAHDLRGPIGGMASLLDTIAKDRGAMSPEELSELIDALRSTSQNTSQLLENLLAWSRGQRGELRFAPEEVALYPIVAECAELVASSAMEKGIAIDIALEDGLTVRADPDQMKILLRNLVSNAVKFSLRGDRVSIAGSKVDGGIRLVVRDEGIGMERAQLEALCASGSIRSRPGTANERGSGLGFLLCKEIVGLHGGSIEAKSEPGRGSVFTVLLPG